MMDSNLLKAMIKSNVTEKSSGVNKRPSMISMTSSADDDDYVDKLSYISLMRSPEGPMGGRSVKEYEEQMSALKKENFDLKLRMYFLEEKLGPNFSLEKEEILQKNVDLEMEIENLRKDVQEKHNLLCEAVKAMELSDEEYKRSLTEKSDEIDRLQDRIKSLEEDISVHRDHNSIDQIRERCNRIYYEYDQLEVDVQHKDDVIKDLQDELNVAMEKITKLSEKVNDLEQEIEVVGNEKQKLTVSLSEKTAILGETEMQLQENKKRYNNLKAEYDKDRQRLEKQKLVSELKTQELEEELTKQKQRVYDLQKKLAQMNQELKSNQNLLVSDTDKVSTSTKAQSTDPTSVVVQDTAASPRISEKNALCDSLNNKSPSSSSSPTAKSSLSSLGHSGFNLSHFEKLVEEIKDVSLKLSLQEQASELCDTVRKLEKKIANLKTANLKFCSLIQGFVKYKNENIEKEKILTNRIRQLEQKIAVVTRDSSISGTPSNTDLKNKEDDFRDESERLGYILTRLEEKVQELELFNKNRKIHIDYLESQNQLMLSSVQNKDSELIHLERRLSQKMDKSNPLEAENNESIYKRLLEEKTSEIKKLNEDLCKKNCDLQAVVNKELWEKNKEIEKMQLKHRKDTEEKEVELDRLRAENANLITDNEVLRDEHEEKDMEISRLKIDLSDVNLQLQLLKEKICDIGIRVNNKGEIENYLSSLHDIKNLQTQIETVSKENANLKRKLSSIEESLEKARDSSISELYEKKLNNLEKQYELSEHLRQQTTEACSLLRGQLQELALFLDSLVKQKSVLGFLGTTQNKKLRDVIDQSLDLSRSLTASFSINPDQSLHQLSNITDLLNNTDALNVTENTHNLSVNESYKNYDNQNKAAIIKMLEEQIQNLRCELEIRDSELNRIKSRCVLKSSPKDLKVLYSKNKTPPKPKRLENNSEESETWSEPDVNVSKERIGLNDTYNCAAQCSDSTDDSTGFISSDTKTKGALGTCQNAIINLKKQVKNLQTSLNEKESNLLGEQKDQESYISLLKEENDEYRLRLGVLEPEFNKIKSMLLMTEQKKSHLEKELDEIKLDLEKYVKNNETLIKQNEHYNQKLVAIEAELNAKNSHLTKLENEKMRLENLLDEAKYKIKLLEISSNDWKTKYESKETEMSTKITQFEFERQQLVNMATEYAGMTENSRKELATIEAQIKNLNSEKEQLQTNLKNEYEKVLLSKLKIAEDEFAKSLNEVQREATKQVDSLNQEIERLLKDIRNNYVKKCEVDSKINEVETLKQELEQLKEEFSKCKVTMESNGNEEKRLKDEINRLSAKLDEATLQYSNVVLEKTTLNNAKMALEEELDRMNAKKYELEQQFEEIHQELTILRDTYQNEIANLQNGKSKLEVKVSELEYANAELHYRLAKLNRRDSGDHINPASDLRMFDRQTSNNSQNYTSEDEVKARSIFSVIHKTSDSEREANASPDLGIESDQGRFSSLEAVQTNLPRPLLQTLEITESMNNLLDGDRVRNDGTCENKNCYQKSVELSQENTKLKEKLLKTRKALDDTVTQLKLANQRKKQVELGICKQIKKTSQVLREAKANLDSGSETDVCKK